MEKVFLQEHFSYKDVCTIRRKCNDENKLRPVFCMGVSAPKSTRALLFAQSHNQGDDSAGEKNDSSRGR